ncbi:MAG: hypothetical protein JXR03_09935 [Cyclobacteriaceae bacterium]
MMKYFYLFFLTLLLSQCKIVESSTGQTTKIPDSPRATALAPDECLVNAKVLRLSAPGVYSLRVYEVKEIGFGFSQNINSGDKIDVRIPLPLKEDETRDLVLTWIESPSGGYFEVNTGAE